MLVIPYILIISSMQLMFCVVFIFHCFFLLYFYNLETNVVNGVLCFDFNVFTVFGFSC